MIGCAGFCCIILSIKLIKLSEAISLMFLSPVWYYYLSRTGIFAFLLLKEPYSKIDFLSSIVSIFGMILILKPSFLFDVHNEEK